MFINSYILILYYGDLIRMIVIMIYCYVPMIQHSDIIVNVCSIVIAIVNYDILLIIYNSTIL